jgi:hypothetical protein
LHTAAALFESEIAKIGKNSPIAFFIGARQGSTNNKLLDPQVTKFIFMSLEAQTNVAQRIQRSQLSEKQQNKLIPTVQIAGMIVAGIVFNTFVKLIFVNKTENLRKNIFTSSQFC